jgi:hypothetical protein
MRSILIILVGAIFLCSSCSNTLYRSVKGTYDGRGKDFYYSLSIDDSSFILTQKYFEANSSCKGSWQRLTNDTILLRCDDVDISVKLQSGYMSERERKVIVLTKNKIQVGTVILKRIKQ